MSADDQQIHRCGYIAIAGVPNVGKSTLLNALMGMKLSIIARRPQSTRRNVLGILTGDSFQAILVDTPGLLDPVYRLQSVMRAQAVSAIEGADALLLMVDSVKAVKEGDVGNQVEVGLKAAGEGKPVVLALNKIDRVEKKQLLPLLEEYDSMRDFKAIVPISALRNDGLQDLLEEVIKVLPEGPPLYPEEMVTEHPERFFVAELVREVVFRRFSKEIPYSTTTQVEEFRRGGRKTYISVVIYVERETQRPILLGKGGRALKEVGRLARESIEEFLDEEVYLDLWVKVREGWRDRDAQLRDLELL